MPLTEFDILVDQAVALAGGAEAGAGAGVEAIDITHLGAGVHRVVLDGAAALAAWTTLHVTVVGPTGGESTFELCLAHLPCDVDGNGEVNTNDATAFGTFWHGDPGDPARDRIDLDGNGEANLNDATVFGQLWHGTAGHQAWQGRSLPEKPVEPVGCADSISEYDFMVRQVSPLQG